MVLTYLSPAEHWAEAIPIGNGTLGALVFGRTYEERIALNHDHLWAGKNPNRPNPFAAQNLKQLQQLLFKKQLQEAEALARETQLGVPEQVKPYEPLADLSIELPWRGPVTSYSRSLDYSNAQAQTCFYTGHIAHKRICFASYPDQVIIVRHEVEPKSSLSAKIFLSRLRNSTIKTENNIITLQGSTDDQLLFAIIAKIIFDEVGKTITERDHIRFWGASSVTIILSASVGENAYEKAQNDLMNASQFDYETLQKRHQEDFQSLMNKVTIRIGSEDLPSTINVIEAQNHLKDKKVNFPFLTTATLTHRQFLLISSSRPGSLPSNLQGIWNIDYNPPWNSDFHTNINLQMNYWPTERLGLGETVKPLFAWMKKIKPYGEEVAKKHYNCRGWVLHHLSDRWGTCTPCDGVHGIWPMGAAWLCQHLWWHYEFHGDQEWLHDEAWEFIRDATRFILDFLIEAPQNTICPGKLVTNPSHSPENFFKLSDGSISTLTYASTMDIAIIRELFRIALATSQILGDLSLIPEITYAWQRLPSYSISPRTNCLMEWIEDYEEVDPGHRHISHLFGLHPGIDISPHRTPELARAAKNSLLWRIAHRDPSSVDHDTGWSLGWMACLWANLGEGDRALEAIEKCLAHRSTPNLMTNAHNAPQVSDAFGITEAMLEMLVQDRDGTLRILPALPTTWESGYAKGLHLRGGHLLDLEWDQKSSVWKATLTPGWAKTIQLPTRQLKLNPNKTLTFTSKDF